MILFSNFVLVSLSAAMTSSQATGVKMNSAVAPWSNIPDPSTVSNGISYLVLTDNPAAPTKFEIISYTGYAVAGNIFTLTGVQRHLGGTSAQSWAAGTTAYQAPTTLTEQMLLWTVNPTTGDIGYAGGNVAITKGLGVNGNMAVYGDFTAHDGIVSLGATVAESLAVVDSVSAQTLTSTGNTSVGGALAVTGGMSALSALLGANSQQLGSYRYGTWTPTLIGSSSAGTPVYTAQTGLYIIIGKMMLLEFTINISSFSSSPSGDMILSGYPSVGTEAGYAGSLSQFAGVNLFRGYESNIVGAPGAAVSDVIQHSVALSPVTLSDVSNQGIKFKLSVHTNDQSKGSLQTQAFTASRFMSALDFIYNGTSGEALSLAGSIMFQAKEELVS